jgi:hypothetical protein
VLVTTIAILLGLGSPAPSHAAAVVTDLAATAADADASGRARLVVRKGSKGRFKVNLKRLAADTTFALLVDGVKVATVTSNQRGKARLRFRTRPRARDLFLGFDPRGASLLVRDSAGTDVLIGTLPGDSLAPSTGACCDAEREGQVECEVRSAAECAARGETLLAGVSCLPNPCAGAAPPGRPVVCCLPDDGDRAECEDRPATACLSQNGFVVEGRSCGQNPCGGFVPAGDIQCCLPDSGGFECEDRTESECAAQGGVSKGAGACVPDPCRGISTPGGAALARVRCERRTDRSKVSVDGQNLAQGSYQARIASGANQATSGTAATSGDEVEFDFDSEPDDVAAGATAIAADFIQGPPLTVTGQILDAGGAVVAEATVACEAK